MLSSCYSSVASYAHRSNTWTCQYNLKQSPVLLQRLAAFGVTRKTRARHCMGWMSDSRWPNGRQFERAIRHGRTAERGEMIMHDAHARSSRYHNSFQKFHQAVTASCLSWDPCCCCKCGKLSKTKVRQGHIQMELSLEITTEVPKAEMRRRQKFAVLWPSELVEEVLNERNEGSR